jgi:hypothetical protein
MRQALAGTSHAILHTARPHLTPSAPQRRGHGQQQRHAGRRGQPQRASCPRPQVLKLNAHTNASQPHHPPSRDVVRYRVDHKDVVYFGSCAVVFMLPPSDLPPPASSPLRHLTHASFATASSGQQLPLDARLSAPVQSTMRLPVLSSPPPAQAPRLQQQQQKMHDSKRDVATPTMSELRHGTNAEVLPPPPSARGCLDHTV